MVERHAASGTRPQTSAFLRTRDAATGAETRAYLDGRRVTIGRDFVKNSGPHQLTVLTHSNGLREVSLPDRRRMFHEQFGFGRHGERVIMRTMHTAMIGGAVVTLGAPRVWTYTIVHYGGVVFYPYVPFVYEPVWYGPFFAPFPVPIVVGPDCLFCPAPVLVFGEPVVAFADASELLADMVLASAVQENLALLAATAGPPAPDPEVEALAAEVGSLQQQLAEAGQSNEELRAELGPQRLETGDLRQAATRRPPPPAANEKLAIPQEVRRQVQQQVQQCVALHQENKPLMLPDVIASTEAKKYVFQVGEPIQAANVDTDETCSLTTGDLASFADVPDKSEPSAKIRVVTSRVGSCPVGAVVRASFADLQEMLNGFNQRLEQSMKLAHDHLAATPAAQANRHADAADAAAPVAGPSAAAAPTARPSGQAESVKPEVSAPPKEPNTTAAPAAPPSAQAKDAKPEVSAPTKEPNAVAPRPAFKGTVAGVIDAATLVIGERQIKLEGVKAGPVEMLASFAGWVQSRSPVECQERDPPGVYRCLTGNGVDVGEAAILNGMGRAGAEASALYKQRETEAKQNHRGLWKSP